MVLINDILNESVEVFIISSNVENLFELKYEKIVYEVMD